MSHRILKRLQEIKELLERLNYCHDASIKNICFVKQRSIDEKTGDLVYPFEQPQDLILCDIKVELLHNNYDSARKDQIVIFTFHKVIRFNFIQNADYDYSDLRAIYCEPGLNTRMEFKFHSARDRVVSLSFSCSEVSVEEK